MPRLRPSTASMIAAVFILAAATPEKPLLALGIGAPFPPSLDFPQEGAFSSKSLWCVLLSCPEIPSSETTDAAAQAEAE
ncbi:hypothetical protein [Yoonia litorea]|uniref:Secreted protein n=1 Tax=Yoonia litorea TaxID=1123755 RepID=A0A1I6MLM6_9RHOB|nr:hypothetical protein [Yoonia litorea]SFS16551.1 hypothetical protein SAMN05444714_2011 [Yoonia litorea]